MKEAIATVSQHSHSSESLTDPHSDFGANEWLVDEMYDQYLKDKDSVDASWQRYFAAHPAANGASAESNGGSTPPAAVATAPAPPKATPAPAPTQAPAPPAPAAPGERTEAPRPR